MRRKLVKLGAGVVAALAAGLIFPLAAQASPVVAAGVPAAQNNGTLAGYQQVGCHTGGFPVYKEIQGTIVVPNQTYINGTSGVSDDVFNIGGYPAGVTAGVEVYNANNQAFYRPFGEWGSSAVFSLATFSASMADKLQVTIQNKGAAGWLVGIVDSTSGKKWSQVIGDTAATQSPCQAAAYEISDFPSFDHLTSTTFIDFDSAKVSWSEKSKSGVSPLTGVLPAGATLSRFNLVNTNSTIAFTSQPTDAAGDFIIEDTGVTTPNMAGYEDVQSLHKGLPYTGVEATFRLPTITSVSTGSFAFTYFQVGIGDAHASGVVAGVEETMFFGSLYYTPFVQFGNSFDVLSGITVHPGDTITAKVYSNGPVWVNEVLDQTTGLSEGLSQAATVSQFDAEVVELRAAESTTTHYPVTQTTPVTFDHATFTNTSDTTYPFGTVLTKEASLRLLMESDDGTQTLAMASPPDADKDGFTVRDGGSIPPAPKS